MSGFEVNYEELYRRADQLDEMNNRFKSMISSLSEKEASLNSMWEGEARDQFHSAFMSDLNQMNVFHSTVVKYVAALRKIAQMYNQQEMANLDIARTRTY